MEKPLKLCKPCSWQDDFLFCWESKTAAPAKPNPLKDGDVKPRVSSNFV